MTTSTSEPVTYAYAVARAHPDLAPSLTGLVGVSGAPVHLISEGAGEEGGGDVVLVVSPVSAADFGEEGLRRHLEDLDWLEAVARAHHAVVEAVAARTPALPLRLATVYLDDASARGMLRSAVRLFSERLDHLAGQVEWGVKIYVEATAEAAPESAPAADLTPGRAYLSARRRRRNDLEASYRAAQEAADRVGDVARAYATDRAAHRPQQGVLAGDAGENVFNDAFLVPRERSEAFRTEAAGAGHGLAGVRVEVTGPWAPYSFAVPQDDEGTRGTDDTRSAADTAGADGSDGSDGVVRGATP
ncbi:GvpL/GvpF family gas vesicle protein [Streptomyces triticiradicis]|uniref:GvpL/GvpF family gas vesicle protein n=1 Tax=Streptomyces triticiradicis TaxID=2651189 RepID=A0A7J5DPC9_9ACTN|nr:GvpL/GvpF family gas vesicle protein [Streptomyces triticiradicis]KAB1990644.1 GvpL/GvpF family gas vesicle protein [Streptomyces triticiradicis]